MRTFPAARSHAGGCARCPRLCMRPSVRPAARIRAGCCAAYPAPPTTRPPHTRKGRHQAGPSPWSHLLCRGHARSCLFAGHGLAHVGGHARRGTAPRASAAATRATARAIGMAVAHAAAPQTVHGPYGPCDHDQQDRHSRQVELQTQDHGLTPSLSCAPMPAREKCFPWIILRTAAGRHPKAASRLKQLTSSQNRHR